MGKKRITISLHTGYSEDELKKKIRVKVKTDDFSYQIDRKSLDARKKNFIRWIIQVVVTSKRFSDDIAEIPEIEIPYRKRKQTVLVVGSGPAGFFCAYVLQQAGFNTSIIERGTEVLKRSSGIKKFEQSGSFDKSSNYAFGEGGAGTFSDGKLTSRTKKIVTEKQFVLKAYVKAGAPEEILYMAHPHLGSDNLIRIVKNLRYDYQETGGTVRFEEKVGNFYHKSGRLSKLTTAVQEYTADFVIFAPGHSAYDTYRMLMENGVKMRTKNFAIGSRIEHPQVLINKAQWGTESLPGIKAAEYRLTHHGEDSLPVYTFCMCPGGKIVPAAAFEDTNIVNGMSMYNRNGTFANAACVAGVNLETLLERKISASQALDWVERLERSFYSYSGNYKAPFCSIKNFIEKKGITLSHDSSYPLGITPAPLWDLFPGAITDSIRKALINFNSKINGFDSGIIMGLESKTSSPVQVIRDKERRCEGFDNLYLIGEGSGYSGGIISSAVEGIKTALSLIERWS